MGGLARLVDIFIAGRPFGVLSLYFPLYFVIYLDRIIKKDCRDALIYYESRQKRVAIRKWRHLFNHGFDI